MNEKRFFKSKFTEHIIDKESDKCYPIRDVVGVDALVDLLNEQQDQIRYWKHKVNSLLWILGQFDEEKVKGLLKELEDV